LKRVLSILSESYLDVNKSQILDLLFEYKEPDINEWYVMASNRAASLFKVTILSGAILGNAPEKDVKILDEAATYIGYSFDIQDDLIDAFATLQQYGRPPGGDIVHRKKPLYLIYTRKLINNESMNLLEKSVGKHSISPEALENIKKIIIKCGALRKTKKDLSNYAEKALTLVIQTRLSDEAQRIFVSFIRYIEESLDWYT
jgi:geranylgeranyl diphosphate synthase type II